MNEEKRKPSVDEIIETLHAAREVCIGYERKYNMLSEQFYELYSQGLLDDDGLNYDFVDWAGSYKTVLECQREYASQIKQSTSAQKIAQLKTYAIVA
ncbi:MAG: hypothetical protein ACRENG_04700 [bacterium]